jgi:hypothetical protein
VLGKSVLGGAMLFVVACWLIVVGFSERHLDEVADWSSTTMEM